MAQFYKLNDSVWTILGFICGVCLAIIPQVYVVLLAFVFPSLTKREPYLIKKPVVFKVSQRES